MLESRVDFSPIIFDIHHVLVRLDPKYKRVLINKIAHPIECTLCTVLIEISDYLIE